MKLYKYKIHIICKMKKIYIVDDNIEPVNNNNYNRSYCLDNKIAAGFVILSFTILLCVVILFFLV
jgi:hypothetical protein